MGCIGIWALMASMGGGSPELSLTDCKKKGFLITMPPEELANPKFGEMMEKFH